VLIFGYNEYDQLGFYYIKNRLKNRLKPTLFMKDNTIKSIVCCSLNTIIYKSSETVLVFGCNEYGQLELGDKNNRLMQHY
jgi:alpha-tubulin suppressor-like RCC1 family protein